MPANHGQGVKQRACAIHKTISMGLAYSSPSSDAFATEDQPVQLPPPCETTEPQPKVQPSQRVLRKRVRLNTTLDPAPKTKRVRVQSHKVEFDSLLANPPPADTFGKHVALQSPSQRTRYEDVEPGMVLYHPARLVVRSKQMQNGVPCLVVSEMDTSHTYRYVGKQLVEECCYNADQYVEVQKKTLSELASLLRHAVGDVLCKVEFTKEPDAHAMASVLQRGAALIEESGAEKEQQYRKLYQRASTGDYRIMRGYILRDADMSTKDSDTGLIQFLDADLMSQRQINLRHLRALVFKNVRYELK